jgi:hypothetical protein
MDTKSGITEETMVVTLKILKKIVTTEYEGCNLVVADWDPSDAAP